MFDWKATIITAALSALCAAGTWVGAHLVAWLKAKSTNEISKGAVTFLQEVVSSLVAHADVELRPALVSAAQNLLGGKLSTADAAALKAKVLATLKATYPDLIEDAEDALGLSNGNAVDIYLSGLIERALGTQRVAGTTPPPAPVVTSSATPMPMTPARATAVAAAAAKATPAVP